MYADLLENAAPKEVACGGGPIEGQYGFQLCTYLDLYKIHTKRKYNTTKRIKVNYIHDKIRVCN